MQAHDHLLVRNCLPGYWWKDNLLF